MKDLNDLNELMYRHNMIVLSHYNSLLLYSLLYIVRIALRCFC